MRRRHFSSGSRPGCGFGPNVRRGAEHGHLLFRNQQQLALSGEFKCDSIKRGPQPEGNSSRVSTLHETLTSSAGGGSYQSSAVSPIVHPYPGGAWNLSSSGGPDVNGLNLTLPVPQPVTWSAPPSASRSNPMTISWSGGDSNGYVDIQATGQSLISVPWPWEDRAVVCSITASSVPRPPRRAITILSRSCKRCATTKTTCFSSL